MTRKLWLDSETRSRLNIKDVGTDRYVRDASTELLMLAWAFDDGDVNIWLPILGEPMPAALHEGITDPECQKFAWNYRFERGIFTHKLGYETKRGEWFDPSVLAGYLSLPIGLDRASRALQIDETAKKIVTKGDDRLTKIFSQLSKTKKTLMKKDPTLPEFYYKDWTTNPEEWKAFIEYCKGDVRAERAVWHSECAIGSPMPIEEVRIWLLDQRMNETGVWIDQTYVKAAKDLAEKEVSGIIAEMVSLTGLKNPAAWQQLLPWVKERGYPFDSLDKPSLAEFFTEIKRFKITPLALEVLELKRKLGGSAYTKLETILDRTSQDGRLRDQFLYHGAHTGRWSGRGVQLQNLFKPDARVSTVLDKVVSSIREGKLDIDAIVAEYNATISAWNAENPTQKPKAFLKPFSVMDAVAGTIRAAFAAPPGKKLVMCDLAQIESRVLAALAGCQTMIDAYAKGTDLYKDIMAFLLEKPYDQITKDERARGKVIILGCGFGMGWEKFIAYAATFGVEIDEKTAKTYVNAFREKYQEIPDFWKALNSGVMQAVNLNICVYVKGMVIDGRNPDMLRIKLPSGRYLHYLHPRVETEMTDWGSRDNTIYEKWDAKGRQISRLYGGLICENIVQAVARDVMAWGMFEAEKVGFVLIMTVHDELVAEVTLESGLGKKDLETAMIVTPEWAEGMGFVLAAEADENAYYRK